jgi:hypothetical protein
MSKGGFALGLRSLFGGVGSLILIEKVMITLTQRTMFMKSDAIFKKYLTAEHAESAEII